MYGSDKPFQAARSRGVMLLIRAMPNKVSPRRTVAVCPGLGTEVRGVVEADELDHARALEICFPYLGEMAGVYSDWTPLQHRGQLFPEDVDADDPWQFRNFRVV